MLENCVGGIAQFSDKCRENQPDGQEVGNLDFLYPYGYIFLTYVTCPTRGFAYRVVRLKVHAMNRALHRPRRAPAVSCLL
jgi:hypothetical protein